MTLQDGANLGQVLGAIAVVVSLIYLAQQIRQNSRLLRASALEAQAHTGVAMLQTLAQDRASAAVFARGLRDIAALDEAERTQFTSMISLAFLGFQTSWYLQQDGLTNPDMWERQQRIVLFYLEQPGVRQWWHAFARDRVLSAGFVRFVEEQIEVTPLSTKAPPPPAPAESGGKEGS